MSGEDAGDFSQRLDKLGRTLDAHSSREAARVRAERVSNTRAGYAQAVKLSSEFIGAVVVGAGMGWLIDSFAGTSPFGLIVFLLLGFVAGVLNVLRTTGKVATPGVKPGAE